MQVNHDENIVEVNNLSFGYGDRLVLKDINLNIHRGDYLGLVGPNGGGKTTLVKLILGLIPSQSGEIRMNTKSVGYVAQKATNIDSLFPVTAREVVAMGNNEERANKALDEVGLLDLSDRLIGDLSGGQQQRVFIARALAQEAEVIFLDEPTSGVDLESQEQFYNLLSKLNHDLGITLILISHDIEVITEEVTELACINQTMTYHGSPKEFLNDSKVIHHHH